MAVTAPPYGVVVPLLFPTSCLACGTRGEWLCGRCHAALVPAPGMSPPVGLDACAALVVYEGVARSLIAGLKYRNRRCGLSELGRALAQLAPDGVDVVTWAPTSASRRRSRGFDQAALLARSAARELGVACAGLLRRQGSDPQTGRSAHARASGPSFTPARRQGTHVLLVDDVITTGATMVAAAASLRRSGAGSVAGVALAHTPLKVQA